MPYKTREARIERQREYRKEHIEAGLCESCVSPLSPKSVRYCAFHLRKNNRPGIPRYKIPPVIKGGPDE
jgi:hypothetical protein